ncbi:MULTISPECIES: CvpA family protein [Enterocloster]|uniref:Colicin V production protein n=1 Tax=Enterocloster lavalensis TaxID=460384 RepID=A0A1I0K1Z8_9FIRM|nr:MULTISPECIES: CvpA family protein [Enterocloster]MDR3755286.1 CvpA family protein [Enterocloster sp.]SEU16961.1 Colicin V production protein [Enterocloster lavalensis]
MNYVVDIVVVALLAAFAGRGVTRGLILSAGKLVTLAGGLVGAHLGAFYLKAPVAERIILPWLSASTGGAAENGPVEQIMGELAAAGVEGERVLMDLLESMGFPRFSISRGWGTLIDRLTGTGTNIMETARNLVAQRIAYVLLFIILFLGIQLVMMILFTSMDGLKNLPIAGLANKLGGGALGLVTGGIAVWGIMTLLILFVPAVTEPGGILSPEVLDRTKVAKEVFEMARKFLGGA